MRTRLGTRRPRARLLRLLRDDRLLLLGHGCCCHCVPSGTELSIALILDRELLLLLLLLLLRWLRLLRHAATYLVSVVLTVTGHQSISISILALPRRGNSVARLLLLLLLLQGCKQRSSLQYENEDRELDQSRLRAIPKLFFSFLFVSFFDQIKLINY